MNACQSKYLLFYLSLAILTSHSSAQPSTGSNAPLITTLDFRGTEASQVARALSTLTGRAVVVSSSARTRTVEIALSNVTLETALRAICRSADLVYRYDSEAGIYTLMELKDYQQSASGDAENLYLTETFKVEPANLRPIAFAIESLYGDRVYLTEGQNPENFAIDRSGGNLGGLGGATTAGSLGIDPNAIGSSGQNDFGAFGGSQSSFNSQQTFLGRGGSFGRSGGGGGGFSRALAPSEIASDAALDAESARSQLSTAAQSAATAETERRARARGSATIFLTTNPEHNLIIARSADRESLRTISELVVRLDQPLPQVILEMKVLQLDVGDGLTTGVNWQGRKGDEFFENTKRDPVTGLPQEISYIGQEHNYELGRFASNAAANFAYEFISKELRTRVEMLASDNRVEVVATPLLIATNNRSAQIRVGEERIITVGASSDRTVAGETGTRNETITVETEKRTIGTTVRIIPRINQDRTVTLNVLQESTTLKPKNNEIQAGSTIIPIDSVDTASVQATVTAKDGNTVAVGGLIRNETTTNRQKVPLLGELPLIGRAFRRDVSSSRKTELILLITPRLLDHGEQNGGAYAMRESEELMRRNSDHRWHAAGDAPLEQDNPQLRRYRATREEANPDKSAHWQPTKPPKARLVEDTNLPKSHTNTLRK